MAEHALKENALPTGIALNALLGLEPGVQLEDLISNVLHDPLQNFLARPSKAFRAELVKIAFLLCSDENASLESADERLCTEAARVLEHIHAGSLVVDDIQDASSNRRGALTLHRQYGLPIALNAGNFLYFWPLRAIHEMPVSPETRLRILEACHLTMLRAHYGQALDIGVRIDAVDRQRVADVCRSARVLKSGALMALAAKIGGLLAKAEEEKLLAVEKFGSDFGLALQIFDDIGNLHSKRDPEKRFEDLRLMRPSFVWEVASSHLPQADFERFVQLSRQLPETSSQLTDFISHQRLEAKARLEARNFLVERLNSLRKQTTFVQHTRAISQAEALAHRLMGGYD